MKIKLSKSQWEEMGRKAGWMKQTQFDHRDPKNYTPGQTPYTDEEWEKVKGLIGDAAKAEESGAISDEEALKHNIDPDMYKNRRRIVKVIFSDGDHLTTWINGTMPEILKYYMPLRDKSGKPRGVDQDYSDSDPQALRHVVDVQFLD